jgi:hypothetical protein
MAYKKYREELKRAFWRATDRLFNLSTRYVLERFVFDSIPGIAPSSVYFTSQIQNTAQQLEKDLVNIVRNNTDFPIAGSLAEAMHTNIDTLFKNYQGELEQLISFYLQNKATEMTESDLKKLIQQVIREVTRLVYKSFAARLLSLIRWFVFVHYINYYETYGDFEIVYVPLLKGNFHAEICKRRAKLFKKVPFSEVYNLFKSNAREYKGHTIVESERGTFLNPHYGCDSMWFAVDLKK